MWKWNGRLKISLSHERDETKWKKSGKKPQQMAFLAAVMNWKMKSKFRKVHEHHHPSWMAFLNRVKECAHFPHGRLYNFVAFRRNKMQQIRFAPWNSYSSPNFCQGYWNKWSAKLESDRFFLSLWDRAHGMGKARNKTKTVASTQIFFLLSFHSCDIPRNDL